MNPAVVCREPGYPVALAFTYSFDPVFFDRMVLPSLWRGGTEEALVLADGGEVTRAFARIHGPIGHLGRRYLLSPVQTAGSFHPKLLLRFGKEGGLACLGSGNLTHGGWGVNCELGAAWRFGPGLDDDGAWARQLLEQSANWAPTPLARRALERIENLTWLPGIDARSDGRVLLSGQASLGTQLARRWAGRRFDRVRFVTGSTDETGEVLGWLHRTFGVEEAVGAVTPSRCALNPAKLGEQPVNLRLIPYQEGILHAKAYHLSGPDGDALLVGSANLSPSAWLRPPGSGGNVEAVLVYENPTSDDLGALDELLSGVPVSPSAALTEWVREPEQSDHAEVSRLGLEALQVMEDGTLVVRVVGGMMAGWRYQLDLEGQPIRLHAVEGELHAQAGEALPAGRTAFGEVEGFGPNGETKRSGVRWVDDLRFLHDSALTRTIARILGDLSRTRPEVDPDSHLEELYELAHSLLEDFDAVQDPMPVRTATMANGGGGEEVRPVDPAELIQSLQGDVPDLARGLSGGTGALSYRGVYRILFGGAEELETGTETSGEAGAAEPVSDAAPPPSTDPVPHPPSARSLGRFAQHLDNVLARMETASFREECSAARLSQAAAYPYAAIPIGMKRGLADRDKARSWLLKATRIFVTDDTETGPLLEAVEARHRAEGKLDAFRVAIGSGPLWVTLIMGLIDHAWPQGQNGSGSVQKEELSWLLLLRRVWADPFLTAKMPAEGPASLIRDYRSPGGGANGAVEAYRSIVAPAIEALFRAEDILRTLVEADLLELQRETRGPIQAGELLWGPGNGWAVALTDERKQGRSASVFLAEKGRTGLMKIDGYFVSVPQAADLDGDLAHVLEQLHGALRSRR